MIKKKKVATTKKKKNMNNNAYQYTAVFEPAIEGGYNVSFPSFPGCVTCGDTLIEAKKMAKEALEHWIEELLAQNETLPPPSQ
jgi:predicted RNase H-like HicB family nuclease